MTAQLDGTNSDTPTPYGHGRHPHGQYHNRNAHCTVNTQAPMAAQAVNNKSQLAQFPVLPASPSRTANKTAPRCCPKNTPSRAGQPATSHKTPPRPHEDMHTPPRVFMPPGIQPIQPQPREEEGGLPTRSLPLNPRSVFRDPWSPEYAHSYPWSVRLGALANTLDDLEPVLESVGCSK